MPSKGYPAPSKGYPALFLIGIAQLAEKHTELLVPDRGANYDQLVEIDLDKVRGEMICCVSC